MNSKQIVNFSNKVALTFIVILIYWVFIMSTMIVFDFKVFRENITEAFMISVLGIMAILFGSVIVNIMLNLTRIADRDHGKLLSNSGKTSNSGNSKKTAASSKSSQASSQAPFKWLTAFLLGFPVIFALLYGGDWATKRQKKELMVSSAQTLIDNKASIITQLTQYEFNRNYLTKAQENIYLLKNVDKYFPNISVLVLDTINQEKVILSINQYDVNADHNNTPQPKPLAKKHFLYRTTQEEREYLLNVFAGKDTDILYEPHKGNYKLYYPIRGKNGYIVLLLSDYQRYGKFGS